MRWVSTNEVWVWSTDAEAECDEVLETTEEFCCARRMVRSRVSRLTYARAGDGLVKFFFHGDQVFRAQQNCSGHTSNSCSCSNC